MSSVRIVRRGRRAKDIVIDPDPTPIPNWLDDPEEVAPCPCGQPPDDNCMLIEGDVSLSRWFHMGCLDFLEKEMDEEEIEEKREWEKYMRRMREEDDDE
jgi:hypothetical protein